MRDVRDVLYHFIALKPETTNHNQYPLPTPKLMGHAILEQALNYPSGKAKDENFSWSYAVHKAANTIPVYKQAWVCTSINTHIGGKITAIIHKYGS